MTQYLVNVFQKMTNYGTPYLEFHSDTFTLIKIIITCVEYVYNE